MSLVERIANACGAALERRISRRSAVSRAALTGSAFAVAPLRYLLRPVDAWAVIGPGGCPGGSACTDGYSAFCCEIQGGHNRCPPDTYVAGWWKCTDYRGGGLCKDVGVRYYIDCNRVPGLVFRGGCQCARGSCERRRIDCNQFRYGQCNTQIAGTTEVVCRLVVCQNPVSYAPFHCNGTLKVDNTTCSHEMNCLRGLGEQEPGGGGA